MNAIERIERQNIARKREAEHLSIIDSSRLSSMMSVVITGFFVFTALFLILYDWHKPVNDNSGFCGIVGVIMFLIGLACLPNLVDAHSRAKKHLALAQAERQLVDELECHADEIDTNDWDRMIGTTNPVSQSVSTET